MDDWMIRMAAVLPPGMTVAKAAEILKVAFGLTPRESEVAVHLLVDGTEAEIGRRLGCSGSTVKKHCREIIAALRVKSCRGAAVEIAVALWRESKPGVN